MATQLFFGASTGRTATMHLANTLNAEAQCVCVHEGKFRHRETSGEQLIPFLTLENRIAYEYPERAADIIASKRAELDRIEIGTASHFGDIAYNYCPFLRPLAQMFPEARFIVIFRDGISFLRSATQLSGEDEVPVGWPPDEKPLTDLERYISLGRLQPRRDSPEAREWESWGAFEKNTWLWAETNRVVLDAVNAIGPQRVHMVRFEEFVASPLDVYGAIREFLGFTGEMSEEAQSVLLSRKVNARKEYWLPGYGDWTPEQKEFFRSTAGPVMQTLGYDYE